MRNKGERLIIQQVDACSQQVDGWILQILDAINIWLVSYDILTSAVVTNWKNLTCHESITKNNLNWLAPALLTVKIKSLRTSQSQLTCLIECQSPYSFIIVYTETNLDADTSLF